YFGAIPDFAQAGDGCALTGVSKNSPAERGGIKPGDVIVKLGESKITSLEDFDSALRKFKAGDKVAVVLRRGKEMVTVEVRLDPPR
ncbi:MAG TPA: PDZ domain-containing protein, partial [Pirellulaceae bacterium]|nr:PDZ domain-containing protein [Pirellulaceae bacterium]